MPAVAIAAAIHTTVFVISSADSVDNTVPISACILSDIVTAMDSQASVFKNSSKRPPSLAAFAPAEARQTATIKIS